MKKIVTFCGICLLALAGHAQTNLPFMWTNHSAGNMVAVFGSSGSAYPVTPAATGQTNSYADYDDGYYQTGTAWPDPRFTVLDNTNCVRDNLTGLVWARDASNACGFAYAPSTCDWSTAITTCEGLDYGGRTDWRLPNIIELQSLSAISINSVPLDAPFNDANSGSYFWSSTTYSSVTTYARRLRAFTYNNDNGLKTAGYYVWPVAGPD